MATVWELTRTIPADELGSTEFLLNQGWEPFAIEEGRMWFKRAVPMDFTQQVVGLASDDGAELVYSVEVRDAYMIEEKPAVNPEDEGDGA